MWSADPNGQDPVQAREHLLCKLCKMTTRNVIKFKTIDTPYGALVLGIFKGEVCLCDWKYRKMRDKIDARIKEELQADFEEGEDRLLTDVESQLNQYFAGERKDFDLPVLLIGTEFQKKVWQALRSIPYGETETYLSFSRKLGDEKAIRAVASANGANAISIIIPCHRILGSKGELVGYAGGLRAKKELLKLENQGRRPEQLEMFD